VSHRLKCLHLSFCIFKKDTCNANGICMPNWAANGSPCGFQGSDCTHPDSCLNGVCVSNGFRTQGAPCGPPPINECQAQSSCSGDGSCILNFLPQGTLCGPPPDPNNPCDAQVSRIYDLTDKCVHFTLIQLLTFWSPLDQLI